MSHKDDLDLTEGGKYETPEERKARIEAIKDYNDSLKRIDRNEKVLFWGLVLGIFGFILCFAVGIAYQNGRSDGLQKGNDMGEASAERRLIDDNPYSDNNAIKRVQGYCNSIVQLPYGLTSSKDRPVVCKCVIDLAHSDMQSSGWTSFNDYYNHGVDESKERYFYTKCV